MHATLFVDPGRPSQHSPIRALCVGFWAVKTIAICSAMLCIATLITGLYQDFRECGLPCGLHGSLCTLQLLRSVTSPPKQLQSLGMGGWLDLTQQGLSPCKKRQACLAH